MIDYNDLVPPLPEDESEKEISEDSGGKDHSVYPFVCVSQWYGEKSTDCENVSQERLLKKEGT